MTTTTEKINNEFQEIQKEMERMLKELNKILKKNGRRRTAKTI